MIQEPAPDPALVRAHLAKRELARRRLLDYILYTKESYQAAWFHEEICGLLDAFVEDVIAKRSPRVMIFLPPGTGKSEIVSRRWPTYCLGRFPTWQWITATYGQDLANEFGRDVRGIIEEPAYRQLFPDFQIRDDANAVADWVTTAGGKYRAVGVGGPTTGKRANIFVVDDPIKDMQDADSDAKQKESWDFFNAVASTRLFPGGGILITQTLWSLQDTSMRLLRAAEEHPEAEQWTVYKFPMLAVEDERRRKIGESLHEDRYSRKDMERKRATYFANGQARVWHSLFQCNPTPDEGTTYRREWLKLYKPGTVPSNHISYTTTDFAVGTKESNDWSVICSWAVCEDGAIYLKRMIRGRFTPHQIVSNLVGVIQQDKPYMYALERTHQNQTIGPYLNDRMRAENVFSVCHEIVPHKDKLSRSASILGRAQMGMIYLPDEASTHDIIIPELLAFPSGLHDDVPDCFSQLGLMLDKVITPPTPAQAKAPDGPPTGSMAWVRSYGNRATARDTSATHVPRSLTGRLPDRVDREAMLR